MTSQDAEKPIPEHFAGTVLPGGRGMELHGVPLNGTPDLVDERDHGEDVLLVELPPPPDPVPVVIVHTGGRELRRMRTQRAYASPQASQIVGRDGSRSKVRIRNLSTTVGDRAWIAQEPHLANGNLGYPLDPGAEIVLEPETEIWTTADAAATSPLIALAVLVEYAVVEH